MALAAAYDVSARYATLMFAIAAAFADAFRHAGCRYISSECHMMMPPLYALSRLLARVTTHYAMRCRAVRARDLNIYARYAALRARCAHRAQRVLMRC